MSLLSRYEWLLFDADNTLFDFDGASVEAFYQTLNDYNIKSDPESYKVYKKINLQVWEELELGMIDQIELRKKRFRLFLEKIDEDKDPVKMNHDYLMNLVAKSQLYDEAFTILDHLQGKYSLGIITNGLKEVQRPRIKKVKIERYFEVIVVSDEIGFAKPNKGFFDHTFKECGNPDKEKVLVIGDSLKSDIKGGNDYGVDTCWYNPQDKVNNHDFKPTYTINRLNSLIRV